MIKLNGEEIDVTIFPDNTSQVWQKMKINNKLISIISAKLKDSNDRVCFLIIGQFKTKKDLNNNINLSDFDKRTIKVHESFPADCVTAPFIYPMYDLIGELNET